MIGGTFGCPPGANERAFLAGSFTVLAAPRAGSCSASKKQKP